MRYETEAIVAALKAARERKGLSQRELGARVGLPQSHISKIETGGADLRVSSLTSIANALDLEIALVSRKAVSTVRAINRTVDDAPKPSSEVRKEFARIGRRIDRLRALRSADGALAEMERRFREIGRFRHLLRDTDALRRIRRTLETATTLDDAGATAALREAGEQMAGLRTALVRDPTTSEPPRARPAYCLEEEDV